MFFFFFVLCLVLLGLGLEGGVGGGHLAVLGAREVGRVHASARDHARKEGSAGGARVVLAERGEGPRVVGAVLKTLVHGERVRVVREAHRGVRVEGAAEGRVDTRAGGGAGPLGLGDGLRVVLLPLVGGGGKVGGPRVLGLGLLLGGGLLGLDGGLLLGETAKVGRVPRVVERVVRVESRVAVGRVPRVVGRERGGRVGETKAAIRVAEASVREANGGRGRGRRVVVTCGNKLRKK